MTKSLTALFAGALLLAAMACGSFPLDPCYRVACDCASPLTIEVLAPDGGTLTDVTVTGATASCFEAGPGAFQCHVGTGPGTYELELSAPGYKTAQVSETIAEVDSQGCCNCGYEAKFISVSLQPE